jgi:hypothetical protein
MRTCSKERTNIPITISILHDQEYQLYRLLHRSGRRRAFTERQIELDPLSERHSILARFQRIMGQKTTIVGSKGQQVSSTQMSHQEVDA